jgi:hypothetical protein
VTIRDQGSNTTFLLTPDSVTIAAVDLFKVTVGSTVLTLTQGMWSITGPEREVAGLNRQHQPGDYAYRLGRPGCMAECSSASNGNGGSNTGAPTTTFNGNITQ